MHRQMIARIALVTLLVLVAAALTGCAPGENVAAGGADPAGFWQGLWHGIIAPVTFIISVFKDTVSPYEVVNNGGWYDFGFLLGLSMVFGGGGGGVCRGRKRR